MGFCAPSAHPRGWGMSRNLYLSADVEIRVAVSRRLRCSAVPRSYAGGQLGAKPSSTSHVDTRRVWCHQALVHPEVTLDLVTAPCSRRRDAVIGARCAGARTASLRVHLGHRCGRGPLERARSRLLERVHHNLHLLRRCGRRHTWLLRERVTGCDAADTNPAVVSTPRSIDIDPSGRRRSCHRRDRCVRYRFLVAGFHTRAVPSSSFFTTVTVFPPSTPSDIFQPVTLVGFGVSIGWPLLSLENAARQTRATVEDGVASRHRRCEAAAWAGLRPQRAR